MLQYNPSIAFYEEPITRTPQNSRNSFHLNIIIIMISSRSSGGGVLLISDGMRDVECVVSTMWNMEARKDPK